MSAVSKVIAKLRQGPRYVYFHDAARSRILRTAPVPHTTDPGCEVHVLTSRHDWLDLMWCLKSFYAVTRRRYKLCIHDDGTFDETIAAAFAHHFPDARLIRKAEADRDVPPALTHLPQCTIYRQTVPLATRVFDFAHYLRADRMLVLDSDVLFFKPPTVLLDRIDDPGYARCSFNRDVASFYTMDAAAARDRLGIDLLDRFNAGFGLLQRDAIDFDLVERCLLAHNADGRYPREIDQTLLALLASSFGCDLLPEPYDVRTDAGLGERPSRHYAGAARRLMYTEGLPTLIRQGLSRAARSAKPTPAGSVAAEALS
ncbi:MAG: hypothetical protein AAF586_00605 [Planctomycetota bacterium]